MSANVEFIRSLYAAFSRGDVKTILDNLDPAIDWCSPGDAATIPWGGKRSGVAGAAAFFQALADNLDFETFEPRDFLDAGDHVIVLGHSRARVKKAGGGVFDLDWAHLFTMKGGKVARFREYYDTAAIVAAAPA